jgi:hypothetical protein
MLTAPSKQGSIEKKIAHSHNAKSSEGKTHPEKYVLRISQVFGVTRGK